MFHHHKQTMIRHLPKRRGYALVLVFVFIVLFLAILGVAWRQMASALRIASLQTIQVQRDDGSIHALALALHLLETGLPKPLGSGPYVYSVIIDLPTRLPVTAESETTRKYTITYTLQSNGTWSVDSNVAQSGETHSLLPNTF